MTIPSQGSKSQLPPGKKAGHVLLKRNCGENQTFVFLKARALCTHMNAISANKPAALMLPVLTTLIATGKLSMLFKLCVYECYLC